MGSTIKTGTRSKVKGSRFFPFFFTLHLEPRTSDLSFLGQEETR
jgi:hypothetical protein